MSFQSRVYGFIPTSITGCQVWLDGVDPAGNGVVPSAGTLATWVDKSGSGNNAIAYTGATAPSYSPTTSNVTFGTNYYYISGISSAPSAQTLFMVLRRTSSFTNTPYGTSIGSGATWYMNNTNPSFIAWNPYGQNNSSGANLLFYNDVTNIVCGTNTGGTNIMYLNGTGDTAGSTSFNSGGIMTIGTSSSGVNGGLNQNGFIGTISEVIFYNSVLGTTQRQQIEGYLAQKWGATSLLPSSHPGRSTTLYRSDFTKQNVMRAIPYYTQFSPRQISGCSHWFDATDSSTITLSSGSLTQWNDKSGNGRNLTAVSGFANATVSSAYQNGLNVFNFSGNGLYRTAAGNVSYPLDVYIIVALKSLTTHVDVLGMGDTSVDNFNSLTFAESAASRWHNGSSMGARQTISTSDETSLSFLLIQWSIANSNYLLRRNGTQLIQASRTYSFNNSATAILQIGFRHTDNVYGTYANFSGYIGEIIVFNNQIGTSDRQNVESYLAQKWGLTASLPGGHSHATQPAGAITRTALTNLRLVVQPRVLATGGTVTISGLFRIHTFTSVGTTNFVITSPSSITAQVLVVAGGGAGGTDDGGGGGAGGVIYNAAFTITSGTYGVVVGNGGTSNGANGENSVLSSLTAIGGGGGANSAGNGGNGGSGGGIGWGTGFGNTPGSGTAGQGFAGGGGTSGPNYCAGGGGGAGGVGGTGSGITPGNGGIGVSHTIAGTTYSVGGGGGGGLAFQNSSGTNSTASFGGGNGAGQGANAAVAGTPNTGGGGGGANNAQATNGAFGGSGIVIIAYLI